MSNVDRHILENLHGMLDGGSLIVAGSSAIAHAGWTTQHNMLPEVLCAFDKDIFIPGLRPRHRTPEAMDVLMRWVADVPYQGFPVLGPEMAIADAAIDQLRGGGTHLYDPDDIDTDEIPDGAEETLRQALDALGASPEEVTAVLEKYGAILQDPDGSLQYGR